jgi:hypothetical protein
LLVNWVKVPVDSSAKGSGEPSGVKRGRPFRKPADVLGGLGLDALEGVALGLGLDDADDAAVGVEQVVGESGLEGELTHGDAGAGTDVHLGVVLDEPT